MKQILIKALIAVIATAFSIGATGCKTTVASRTKSTTPKSITTTSNAMPPGQAKKFNGDKSAKKYAPGQQKKNKKN